MLILAYTIEEFSDCQQRRSQNPIMNTRKMGRQVTTLKLLVHILLMMCTYGSGARVLLGNHMEEETRHDHTLSDGNELMKNLELHTLNEDGMHVRHDDINGEFNHLRLHSMDDDGRNDHQQVDAKQDDGAHIGVHEHASVHKSHMNHMDSLSNVFLIKNNLKVGYRMPIHFPKRDPSSSPHFLPGQEADSIPFSLAKLPHLLQRFSFANGSPQAKAMGDTLRECELEPITRETKFCATSLESMLDFTRTIFGIGTQFKVVTSIHHPRESTPPPAVQSPSLQNYTIVDIPMEIPAPKMVACHTMPYPYAIFYCHYQETESKVFRVSVIGEFGDRVEAIVVCHMDTSAWDPNHVSFRVLHIKPGTLPVCHFFPRDHLVWVPLPTSSPI